MTNTPTSVEHSANVAEGNAATSGTSFDPGLLADLTRVLLPFLGPYSITTVKRAARSAENINDLLRSIANHIDEIAKREIFIKGARRIVSDYQQEHDGHDGAYHSDAANKTSPASIDTSADIAAASAPVRPVTPVTDELIQRGEAALAPIIGPLAGVLATRYATRAASSREFFERLAGHLRTPEERDSFFLSVRTGNGTWNI